MSNPTKETARDVLCKGITGLAVLNGSVAVANAGGWYKACPPRRKVHDNLEVLENHVAAELVVELTHRRNGASDLDRVIAIAMSTTT